MDINYRVIHLVISAEKQDQSDFKIKINEDEISDSLNYEILSNKESINFTIMDNKNNSLLEQYTFNIEEYFFDLLTDEDYVFVKEFKDYNITLSIRLKFNHSVKNGSNSHNSNKTISHLITYKQRLDKSKIGLDNYNDIINKLTAFDENEWVSFIRTLNKLFSVEEDQNASVFNSNDMSVFISI